MADSEHLEIEFSSKGYQVTKENLDKIAESALKAETAVSKFTKEELRDIKNTLTVKKQEEQVRAASARAQNAETRSKSAYIDKLAKESRLRQTIIRERKLEQQGIRKSNGLVNSLTSRVGFLTAGYLSLNTALNQFNQLIATTTQYQTLEKQLEFLTGNANSAANELNYLTKTANKYGQELLSSTETYGAMTTAMKMQGLSMKEIHGLYEGLNAVGATFALRQDKMNAIMLAFTQIAGKGKVQSEELVRQLGQYIPALQMGAKAMGVTTAEFNKMLKSGQVLSDNFLPKFAKILKETFDIDIANRTDTISAAQNRFATAVGRLRKEIAEGTPIAAAYKDVLMGIGDAINYTLDGKRFRDAEDALTSTVDLIKNTRDILVAEDPAAMARQQAMFGGGNAALDIKSSSTKLVSTLGLLQEQKNAIRASVEQMSGEDLQLFTKGIIDETNTQLLATTDSSLWDQIIYRRKEVLQIVENYRTELRKKSYLDEIQANENAIAKIRGLEDSFINERVKKNMTASEKIASTYNAEKQAIIDAVSKLAAPTEAVKKQAQEAINALNDAMNKELGGASAKGFTKLQKKLGLNLGIDTESIKTQFDEYRRAVEEQGFDPELEKSLMRQLGLGESMKIKEARQSQLDYLLTSYENEYSILEESLNRKEITEEEFRQRSLEAWNTYQDELANSAGGQKVMAASQKEMWATVASSFSSMTSQLMSSMDDQSSAYKALFYMQKAFAVAQIIVNTELAAAKAMGELSILGGSISYAAMIRGLGYASAGMVAGMAVAGYKDGGVILGQGGERGDKIPIMAASNESILTAQATRAVGGEPAINYINRHNALPPRRADGGMVGSGFVRSSSTSSSVTNNYRTAPNINVIDNVGAGVSVSRMSDDEIEIMINQRIEEKTPRVMQREASNRSSRYSRSMSRNTNLQFSGR